MVRESAKHSRSRTNHKREKGPLIVESSIYGNNQQTGPRERATRRCSIALYIHTSTLLTRGNRPNVRGETSRRIHRKAIPPSKEVDRGFGGREPSFYSFNLGNPVRGEHVDGTQSPVGKRELHLLSGSTDVVSTGPKATMDGEDIKTYLGGRQKEIRDDDFGGEQGW